MSILSQIGVIFLIVFIILVLIRSNRQLVKAAEEGEHFVDEWALREKRRQELLEEEAAQKKRRQESFAEDRSGNSFYGYSLDTECTESEIPGEREIPDNVVPIHREADARITLVELDENRRPIRKIPVHCLPFTIGRGLDNDLVLDNLSVAKKHCRIIRKNHAVVIEDTGSRNKLAVGEAVEAETVLRDQLCLGIGESEFLVEMHTAGEGS